VGNSSFFLGGFADRAHSELCCFRIAPTLVRGLPCFDVQLDYGLGAKLRSAIAWHVVPQRSMERAHDVWVREIRAGNLHPVGPVDQKSKRGMRRIDDDTRCVLGMHLFVCVQSVQTMRCVLCMQCQRSAHDTRRFRSFSADGLSTGLDGSAVVPSAFDDRRVLFQRCSVASRVGRVLNG